MASRPIWVVSPSVAFLRILLLAVVLPTLGLVLLLALLRVPRCVLWAPG